MLACGCEPNDRPNLFLNLFKSGTKQVDIISQVGVGRTSVHTILKAAGLK